ncbi:MAG: hypothetical protein K2Z80_00670 [Xanthobacteraceae bacterium]|nr:hypothetical protein [Xanthobacteraceae bacterium]
MTFQLVSDIGPKAGADSGPKATTESRRVTRGRRRRNAAMARAGFDMLRLYRSNLEVRLRCIDEASLQTESQKRTYASVVEILNSKSEQSAPESEAAWDEVYRAERMIEMLLSGIQLRQEIAARLDELALDNAIEAERFRVQFEAIAKASSQATKNILWCMLAAFVLAILPYIAIWLDSRVSPYWTLFALYTALVSGRLGAFFSRLLTIQRDWSRMSLDEVFLHRELSYSLLRAGVGVCGALVIFFFFKSGLIDGALFPKFENMSMDLIYASDMAFVVPSKDLALVTVWCFLAGFSESLVPSLLTNTERQLSDGAAPSRG